MLTENLIASYIWHFASLPVSFGVNNHSAICGTSNIVPFYLLLGYS